MKERRPDQVRRRKSTVHLLLDGGIMVAVAAITGGQRPVLTPAIQMDAELLEICGVLFFVFFSPLSLKQNRLGVGFRIKIGIITYG